MGRKGGREPPGLSAPPPQDGVSANFTTSAHWWRGRSQYSRASPLPTLLMEGDSKRVARVPDLNACIFMSAEFHSGRSERQSDACNVV